MSTIRTWYLWLKQLIRNALAHCSICGADGVESWSLHPQGLCKRCDTIYNVALARYGTTKYVEDFITTYGPKEFLRSFGGINTNPLAESQESLEEEEIPCFDTFPGPPCGGFGYK